MLSVTIFVIDLQASNIFAGMVEKVSQPMRLNPRHAVTHIEIPLSVFSVADIPINHYIAMPIPSTTSLNPALRVDAEQA